ncbi:hypothetical protein GCM10027187_75360 [Streptosporangium sandarakinum]
MAERVRVYQRMAEADRGTYLPRVAIALFELVLYHRAGLSPASALAFAHDGLAAYEELAGLREPGSQNPVDYDHLTAFTPNGYWGWHLLSGALWNLAWVLKEAGDTLAAAGWMVRNAGALMWSPRPRATRRPPGASYVCLHPPKSWADLCAQRSARHRRCGRRHAPHPVRGRPGPGRRRLQRLGDRLRLPAVRQPLELCHPGRVLPEGRAWQGGVCEGHRPPSHLRPLQQRPVAVEAGPSERQVPLARRWPGGGGTLSSQARGRRPIRRR